MTPGAQQPNARYEHLFAVVRFDDGSGDVEDRTSVVSAYRTEAAADAEAARLNALNAARDCRYVVYVTRLKD